VIVEPSWVPAENQQAAKRIHRIGQEHSCLVYYAATAGSLDEDIIKAVRRKTATIKELGL
jgi:SNF2 family DNA or RNA helicase